MARDDGRGGELSNQERRRVFGDEPGGSSPDPRCPMPGYAPAATYAQAETDARPDVQRQLRTVAAQGKAMGPGAPGLYHTLSAMALSHERNEERYRAANRAQQIIEQHPEFVELLELLRFLGVY